jgi:nucleotide-binding universal stress UspA family protein
MGNHSITHYLSLITHNLLLITNFIIMKTIKNILVPTDFSATASGAFRYAKVLAQALNANITVLHISPFFLAASEIAIPLDTKEEETRLQETMEAFINDDTDDGNVMVKTVVKTKLLKGDAVSRIIELSKSDSTDLIVMGTTGLQDFLSKIIGSVSLDVSNQAHCPVILVPRDAKWQPIDRILFASNVQSVTPPMVREMSGFAQLFGATIHFVHISEKQHEPVTINKDGNTIIDNIWSELYEKSNGSFPFEIHTVYGFDIVKQLSKYVYKNDISLIAFVSKHRNFWQNLMHNSVTQKVAISTEIPMLIMHNDDKIQDVPKSYNTVVKKIEIPSQKIVTFHKNPSIPSKIRQIFSGYRMEGQSFFF